MAAAQPEHRRPGPGLYRYVALEALRPIAVSAAALTFIVLTTDLIGFTELVLNRGVGALEMTRIALLESVPVLTRVLPFAALIGSLVALGRLGADREILALEASGVSASRLTGPIGAVGAVLSLVTAGLSLFGAPASERALDAAFERIALEQPWTQIRAGVVKRFGGWQLEAREVGAKGDTLRGVLLWMPDFNETIFAREGRVLAAENGSLQLELRNASLVLSPERGSQQLRFDRVTTTLPASDEALVSFPVDPLRALTLAGLGEAALNAVDSGRLDAVRREWHTRFATPFTTLLLGFLATPLFLTRSHFSRAGGTMSGVVTMVATFALAQLGEGLTQAGVTGIAGGVWLPNAALALLSVGLFARARREGVLRRSLDRPVLRERAFRALPGRRPDKTRRRALQRYVASRFLQLAGLSFAALLAAYLMVDVLERLDWFARYRASGDEVLRFYAARVPLLASRIVPIALLVAGALIASLLAVEGELIGMRACGIPAVKALAPVFAICVAVTPFYFLLRNEVVPRTNAMADELKQTEIKEDYYRELAESRKTAVWHRLGNRVLEAARFDAQRGDAQELTIYDLGADGLPVSRADASAARHIGRGVWRLREPQRVELAGDRVVRVPARSYVDLGTELSAEVDTMHLSLGELSQEIRQVGADGYDTTPLRVDFHLKLAEALACIVLPAAVLLYTVAGPPFPSPVQTLLASGLLALAQVLLTGVGRSLGYGGTLPPLAAGWLATLLLGILSLALGARVWKRL